MKMMIPRKRLISGMVVFFLVCEVLREYTRTSSLAPCLANREWLAQSLIPRYSALSSISAKNNQREPDHG